MCDRAVSEDPFHLKYGFDRHKTQGMCDIAVDDFLPALKFVADWFVTGKIIKKLHDALFSDDDILLFYEDCRNVTFSSDEMGILSKDFNDNNNLDDINIL